MTTQSQFYGITSLSKTGNMPTGITKKKLSAAGIKPVQTFKTPTREQQLWGQDAMDFILKVVEDRRARQLRVAQKKLAKAEKSKGAVDAATGALLLNRLREMQDKLDSIEALTRKLVADMGGFSDIAAGLTAPDDAPAAMNGTGR